MIITLASIASLVSQSDGVSSDPTGWFAQLGAFAAAAIALVLWQRDTAKQRDRLLELEEQRGPLLVETRDVMRQVLEVMRATSDATKAMAIALERVPSEAEITRMRDALDSDERNRQRVDERRRRGTPTDSGGG